LSAAEKIAEDFSLPSLARAALKDAGGDTDAATASLVERCMTDAVLLRAIIHSAVSTAANYMVEHSMRNERASIYRASRRDEEVVTPIRPSNAPQALLARAAAENAAKRMLDMPLANGAKLGEAERDAVLYQASIHAGPVKSHAARARFYTIIAQGLTEGKKVKEVFTEKRLRDLHASAEKSVEQFLAAAEV
jgi:hypothetical protein